MKIMLVVPLDPGRQRLLQFNRVGPFPQLQQLFLERAHHPLRVSVALWIVIAGEGLCDAHLHHDLRHVDAPPLIRGSSVALRRATVSDGRRVIPRPRRFF